jgi:hypothetical protein
MGILIALNLLIVDDPITQGKEVEHDEHYLLWLVQARSGRLKVLMESAE